MQEKHHLMRHEDKPQTRLTGHSIDMTRASGRMGEGRPMCELQPPVEGMGGWGLD